jgi:hypothetical protein
MNRRYALIATPLLIAATSLTGPVTASAQSHIFVSAGIGGGFFTPSCDTGCLGNRLNASTILLYLGLPITPRIRLEFGAQRVQGTGETGGGQHASSVSLGIAAYLTRNLFVRGGVSRLGLGADDVNGALTEGSGGPGLAAGVGYDIFVARKLAITPYFNFFGGSMKKLEYIPGPTSVPTAGSETALHGGVLVTYWPRHGK